MNNPRPAGLSLNRGIALLALLAGLLIALSPIGGILDRLAYDFNFLVRGPIDSSGEVVVVAIDEASFQDVGHQWPWPRGIHGRLLDGLFSAGARVVALDIIFSESSNRAEDQKLADALDRAPGVVLAMDIETSRGEQFERQIRVEPIAAFKSPSTLLGFAGLPVDSDGFVRSLGNSIQTPPGLSTAAVALYLGQPPEADRRGINFSGPSGTLPRVSYYQALQPGKFLPAGYFKDKLVMVGLAVQSDVGQKAAGSDRYPVPFSRWAGSYMSGVEIHANAAQALISASMIQRFHPLGLLAIAALLGLIASVISFRYTPGKIVLPMIVAMLGTAVISYGFFSRYNIYISWPLLLLPALTVYLSSPFVHFFRAWREKTFIRDAFSSYVSPQVVDRLMDNPELLRLGGNRYTGTVLFIDLAGFTTFSEQLEAEQLVDLLNRNLGALSDIVVANDGMVDKFIGDAIMAVWGAPIEIDQHAPKACLAALQMQNFLTEQTASKSMHGIEISGRIGINSGEFVAGNLGGSKRFDYTVLGNTVNLASRLEGVNKLYQTSVLVSENTARLLDAATPVIELDRIRVKGQQQPVTVYALHDPGQAATEDFCNCWQQFASARGLYLSRRFDQARAQFERLLDSWPDHGPSRVFVHRCNQFIDHPPEQDWDGIHNIDTK